MRFALGFLLALAGCGEDRPAVDLSVGKNIYFQQCAVCHGAKLEGQPDWQRKLVSDPQTSGGLLVACAPAAEKRVVEEFRRRGFSLACRIGSMRSGEATVTVV